MTAFPGCANLKKNLWYSNGHAQQKVSDKALPCKHTLVVFWEDSHHNAPPTPFSWTMTSYHWNAGYRETKELPSPKTHTGRKRGEHKEHKKGLLTCTHTDSATAVKRNSAKLIHTPMQGQTKHAWAHKDKTTCAVGQAAQATLRKRGAVWILFRAQDHTVTF